MKSYQYDFEAFKINSQLDSDKDGLFDVLDPNPQRWNVSERDLRTFSTLSYMDEKELKAIFNDKEDLIEWNKINEDKKEGFNLSFSEEEGRDFVKNWEFVEAEHKGDFLGSGLDYAIFGQGKKENSGYEQLVFSFRGSKGKWLNFQDWYADLKALRGVTPKQAEQIEKEENIRELLEKSDSVYATGHSLGGYLSQYFTAYVMQQSPELQAKMKHSAIFNPLMLLTTRESEEALDLARINNDRLVKEEISNDDVTSNVPYYKTNSYVINGEFLADGGVPSSVVSTATGGGAVIGAISLGILGLITGGLGLGIAAGGLIGAGVGNSLAKEVKDKIGDGFGTYENAVRFEPEKRDWLDSHSLIRFYEKTDKLVEHFSFGSRHDKWQDMPNAYTQDSDNDGIADVVERYFHSDPYDSKSTVAYTQLQENGKSEGESLPTVVYQLGEQTNFSSRSTAQIEHILGNDRDNRLDGGEGNNILSGGKGKDVFVLGNNDFKNQELNIIVDFDAQEDKLDLSVLGITQHFDRLFSNDVKANTLLHWDTENQTLNYQVDNQSFVLAQILNKTEVGVENIVF
ncbi:hypothetical protein BKK54_00660 [Rodentibacter genomosp. 1]|uniref:Peptidase M10 serralysin C-terminal domain-containing protein n=1 Tax=Rodentibacter genomosp. 1 TaxID=1908264 RepID=A0A1V3J9U9_9PAST|nr:hypothetical protein [Rodentibacter genomosp. 1]OOF52163.1 hypothetical protein BKK54_00660 [Rodentibacter genomosp. 1]